MFDSFFRIQMLWEEHMAERIVSYLRTPRGEGKRVVAITGGWHVKYGFGLPKKVVRRMPMPYATVLPEDITPPGEKHPGQTMEVELPRVPLVPADFYWMVSYETLEGKQVRLGVQIREAEGAVEVESVVAGSPAEEAGLRKGDRILSVDGEEVKDVEDVFYRVGGRKEGDVAKVAVRRGGEEMSLPVTLRTLAPPKGHGEPPPEE
jgi:membrane-associated protease RseP (regulator of RpoE activity)